MFQRLEDKKLVPWGLAYLAGAFVVFDRTDSEPLVEGPCTQCEGA